MNVNVAGWKQRILTFGFIGIVAGLALGLLLSVFQGAGAALNGGLLGGAAVGGFMVGIFTGFQNKASTAIEVRHAIRMTDHNLSEQQVREIAKGIMKDMRLVVFILTFMEGEPPRVVADEERRQLLNRMVQSAMQGNLNDLREIQRQHDG